VPQTSVRPGYLSIIVPLEGGLTLTGENVESAVDVGSVAVLTTGSICAVKVRNAYQSSWLNYLEIATETDFDNYRSDRLNFQFFDIASRANQIVSLAISSKISMHFGRYQVRADGEMKVQRTDNLFAFVIDGVCELNDRMLETRDALALRSIEVISFESLSPESVVMMIQGI